ncbi:histidinol dehydrogenase [Ignisphaera aggregans DSM 17230]|uniref:Histidinol dehydrogenase n=1 Tax=Ignisphaera aggregans (strain DSM 17230 / JCM 13409 / AQ1.S1) TaxID=583356 RepID=E0SRC2_IGNAA|nr:histidinol dehydrogenase [Ignisphaera aggregans DSM 17230]
MTVIRGLPERRSIGLVDVLDRVREIIEHVKIYGDKALIELTKKFDGVDIEKISLDREELESISRELDERTMNAIDEIYGFLEEFYRSIKPFDHIVTVNGVRLGIVWRGIDRVGIYVPGGARGYPSTLLMAGIPARVAGVREIYVATPPLRNGSISPAIAYIAMKMGVERVYRIGGAHAIAAMAYGTESIVKVDKIVGPGNIYVQAAKFLVQDVVAIDGIEGPTELIVVADEYADPEKIAFDMMAQAEHGIHTFIVLLTTSSIVADRVSAILDRDYVHRYYIDVVGSIDEAIEIVNRVAPEHLALHVRNWERYIDRIRNVGAISIDDIPPALIDYIGPNHILPTEGWARSRGCLTIYDFLKPVSVLFEVEVVPRSLIEAVKILAEYEGFVIHSKSVGVRYG